MKFGLLALDYGGTNARDSVLSSEVKAAIAEARASGIVVIFATGRILSDLRRVAGDLNFVDAVVAENGAVLAFPDGQTRIVGHLPPQIFFDELRRRGVAFESGQCIVEARCLRSACNPCDDQRAATAACNPLQPRSPHGAPTSDQQRHGPVRGLAYPASFAAQRDRDRRRRKRPRPSCAMRTRRCR